MSDGLTLAWIILIVLIIVVFGASYLRKKKLIFAGTDHIKLYFDEHFKDIISEWDLVTRSKAKTWRADMAKRLSNVSRDIEKIKDFRKSFTPRLNKLEIEIVKLEAR